jgi:hypothetical protein
VANEGIELTEPWEAVLGAGGTPQLVAPEPGFAEAMNHLEMADRFDVDRTAGRSVSTILMPSYCAQFIATFGETTKTA